MVPRDREAYNAYHRVYQLARYHRRRKEVLEALGGECLKCGSKKQLQIDHKDRSKKSFSVGKLWGIAEKVFLAEIRKCQVLCQSCHNEKTVVYDLGRRISRGTHGTLSSYRYCHCDECKRAKREYERMYRKSRKTVK